MSLEAAIEALTEAMKENNTLLKEAAAGRAEVLKAAQAASGAGAAEGGTRGRRPAKDKSEPTTPKGPPSVDDVRGAFGAYLDVDDAAERDRRKVMVVKILEKSGVKKATEIPEADRQRAIDWVNTLKSGEDVAELADEPAEEEDDLMG